MQNYKLYGLPGLDSQTDGGSAATPASQGGFGNAPNDSSASGTAGPSTAPGSITLISDNGSPPPESTNAATTTQTVTFAGSGIVFDNTYTSSVSAAYQSCILSAEQQIASLWTNPVTISVEFTADAEGQNGDLASNRFFVDTVSYASLKSALTSLASTEPGNAILQQAVAHLPTTDPSGGQGFALPLPYAQMLGFSIPSQSPEDTVTLNTSYNWSFGQDVINTVEHEISEGGMGRIGGLGDQNSFWSTMDLFRYNAAGQPDYTDGRDGQTTFFSYNGGATLSTLSFNNEFNSQDVQVNGGDVADFTQQDVFGTGDPGETNTLSQTDIQMMEALGWNPGVGNVVAVGDFNDDGCSDLAYFNSSTSTTTLQFLNGTTTVGGGAITNSGLQGASGWTPVASGDFTNNGYSDLVYYNASLGDTEIQLLNGTTGVGGGLLTHSAFENLPGWTVAGVGDFNGNGNSDLVYYNASLGDTEIQLLNGTTGVGGGLLTNSSFENLAGWTIAGVGDFTGNGRSDLLYYNASLGDTEIQLLNGTTGEGGGLLTNSSFENLPGWTIAGVGDFTGNGIDDLVFYNASLGVTEIQLLNGTTGVGGGEIVNSPFENNPSWAVVGVGDFTDNGIDDLVYYNSSTGVYELQTLNGNVATSTQQISSASSLAGAGGQTDSVNLAQPQGSGQQADLLPATANPPTADNFGGATAALDAPMELPFSEGAQTSLDWASLAGGNFSAGSVFADAAQSQQSVGSAGGLSGTVPPMSSFLSTPAAADQISSILPEPSGAAPIFGANPLQRTA